MKQNDASKRSTQEDGQPSSDVKAQASTQSVESCEETQTHAETFECLSKCTEWYLLAQVGNSQVKIPASQVAVRFQDNPQELPILTKDMDLFESLVEIEQELSTSQTPIVQLNRPCNAGNNPSSSNNVSNSGYRKKENVVHAERNYQKKIQLNLVGDDQSETKSKLNNFPLHLPIDNSSHDSTTRIVDLYLHHRTQQLMCLQFDLTHLKLDEAESFTSGDYSDSFSINPFSNNEGGCDSTQPTPFMGVPKNHNNTGSNGNPGSSNPN